MKLNIRDTVVSIVILNVMSFWESLIFHVQTHIVHYNPLLVFLFCDANFDS